MYGKKWSQAIISFRHDGLDPASRFSLQASDKKRNPDQVRGDGSEDGGVQQATSQSATRFITPPPFIRPASNANAQK
jgi:hypothetical protein